MYRENVQQPSWNQCIRRAHIIFQEPFYILESNSCCQGAYSPWSQIAFWIHPSMHAWRRWWHPTPVLLPGKSHGRRSLVGCSPWSRKGLDTTERLHFHFSLSCIGEGNGNPLPYSCLENPRVRGAWWAAVYGVARSWTRLKRLSSNSSSSSSSMHACSPPGSSVHGILQARILERVVMPFSRGSSLPRVETESPVVPVSQAGSLPLSHQGSHHPAINNPKVF